MERQEAVRVQRIGEALLDAGLITPTQLSAALGEQTRWGNRLGETLVQLGFLAESALIRMLSERVGFPAVDLNGRTIAPDVLDLIPSEIAGKHTCLPIVKEREAGRDVLYVAMEDPSNLSATDDLSFRTGCELRPCLAGPVQIRKAISLCYDGISVHERPIALDLGEPEPTLTPADLEARVEEHWIDGLERAVPSEPVRSEVAPPPVRESASPVRESATPVEEGDANGEVPTRKILQALTRLLIEKDLIDREELVAAIRKLGKAD